MEKITAYIEKDPEEKAMGYEKYPGRLQTEREELKGPIYKLQDILTNLKCKVKGFKERRDLGLGATSKREYAEEQ